MERPYTSFGLSSLHPHSDLRNDLKASKPLVLSPCGMTIGLFGGVVGGVWGRAWSITGGSMRSLGDYRGQVWVVIGQSGYGVGLLNWALEAQ